MRILALYRRRGRSYARWAGSVDLWACEPTEDWMPPEVGAPAALERLEWLASGFDGVVAFGERVAVACDGVFGKNKPWVAALLGPPSDPIVKPALKSAAAVVAPTSTTGHEIEAETGLRCESISPGFPFLGASEEVTHHLVSFASETGTKGREALDQAFYRVRRTLTSVEHTSLNPGDPIPPADLALFPSASPDFHLPALEAMAQGIPCVAREGTPTADLIRNGWNGLLFDDPDLLAGVLSSALQNELTLLSMRNGVRICMEEDHTPAQSREAWETLLGG